eukprot:15438743-Alexandrium_andersonii.AAC.1
MPGPPTAPGRPRVTRRSQTWRAAAPALPSSLRAVNTSARGRPTSTSSGAAASLAQALPSSWSAPAG